VWRRAVATSRHGLRSAQRPPLSSDNLSRTRCPAIPEAGARRPRGRLSQRSSAPSHEDSRHGARGPASPEASTTPSWPPVAVHSSNQAGYKIQRLEYTHMPSPAINRQARTTGKASAEAERARLEEDQKRAAARLDRRSIALASRATTTRPSSSSLSSLTHMLPESNWPAPRTSERTKRTTRSMSTAARLDRRSIALASRATTTRPSSSSLSSLTHMLPESNWPAPRTSERTKRTTRSMSTAARLDRRSSALSSRTTTTRPSSSSLSSLTHMLPESNWPAPRPTMSMSTRTTRSMSTQPPPPPPTRLPLHLPRVRQPLHLLRVRQPRSRQPVPPKVWLQPASLPAFKPGYSDAVLRQMKLQMQSQRTRYGLK
jgi:hypothetical protein